MTIDITIWVLMAMTPLHGPGPSYQIKGAYASYESCHMDAIVEVTEKNQWAFAICTTARLNHFFVVPRPRTPMQ